MFSCVCKVLSQWTAEGTQSYLSLRTCLLCSASNSRCLHLCTLSAVIEKTFGLLGALRVELSALHILG